MLSVIKTLSWALIQIQANNLIDKKVSSHNFDTKVEKELLFLADSFRVGNLFNFFH